MSKVEYVEAIGHRWRRYPESENRSDREYFVRTNPSGGRYYLHREVWKLHNGPIPRKHHIHHKDGNCQNNDISNLECLTPKEHMEHHPTEWNGMREHLASIRPLTKEWHASEEGIAKHREIGALAYKNFEPVDKQCEHCGKSFQTKKLGHLDKYCSNPCKSAARRASGVDNVECVCGFCGSVFAANKYSVPKTCSRACANRLRHRDKK